MFKSSKNKEFKDKKKSQKIPSSVKEQFSIWLTENKYNFERLYKSDYFYPYKCDFYLIDYDLYIDLNSHWTHGNHPFNKDSEEDNLILEDWKSKNNKTYDKAIYVWTKKDVKKREIAKNNNLNYLEIFNTKLDDCVNQFLNVFM